MSEKSSSASRSPNRIDTLIGVGMRIEGDITCTGVLRVQGDILGNVSCRDDPDGTLVVDTAGSVAGTVHATHVAVRGRVVGPVHSSQSIEIFPGASLVGDVSFNELAIHSGGVVEGLLIPALADGNALVRENRLQVAGEAAALGFSTAVAGGGRFMERFGGARRVGAVVLVAVVVAAVAWIGRDPVAITRPADAVAPVAEVSPQGAAAPKLPPAGAEPKAAVAAAAPLAPSLSVAVPEAAPTPAPENPGASPEKVVSVRGANPSRPAGVFLLISNEASILYRKKRDDPGEGARIAVGEGEKVSVAIAPDELIRVAKGRDIAILFQGQKVSRSTIESGAWISFVAR